MAENQPSSFADSIRDARQRLELELRAQAEQIHKLNLELTELQRLHEQTEQQATREWDEVARAAELAAADAAAIATAAAAAASAAAAAAAQQVSPDAALENVLGAVRGMMTCTIPEQVFALLTEEAAQWGVRAAIFDVRGKAAWGASAHGFGPALSENVLRTLIVPLNQDNPFRQVCETAGHVDATAATLKRNRNVLDRLKPAANAPILLVPIRSAGTVAAIFYADPGEKGEPLPVNALKILAEFAGAQIDRLIALSGGFSTEQVEEEVEEPAGNEPITEEAPVEVAVEEPAPAEPPAMEAAAVEMVAVPPAVAAPVVTEPVIGEAVGEVHMEVEVVEPSVPEPEPPAPLPMEVVVELPAPEPEPPAPPPAEVVAEPPLPEPEPSAPPSAEVAVEPPAMEPEAPAPVPVEAAVEPPAPEPEPPAPAPVEVAVETPESAAPVVESEPALPVVEPSVEVAPPPPPPVEVPPPVPVEESAPPPPPPAFDVSQLSETEQKVHKDAKRFAKLLVSEIELYNKTKVADGRKNHDLYKRLKSDIDRSRQTFEKRFGKSIGKQFDYFHDEMVKTLAGNDITVLGPEYPGPSA